MQIASDGQQMEWAGGRAREGAGNNLQKKKQKKSKRGYVEIRDEASRKLP